MGLTVCRKTAKNLAVRRKNERILAVSRYKILNVSRKSHYPIVALLTVSSKKAVTVKATTPLRPSYMCTRDSQLINKRVC